MQNYRIFPHKPPQDPDLEHLKHLITQLTSNPPHNPYLFKQQQYQHKIWQLQAKINELSNQLAQLRNKQTRLSSQLTQQQSLRKQQQLHYQQKIQTIINEHKLKESVNTPERKENSKIGNSQISSKIKKQSTLFHRTETPINQLLNFSTNEYSSPSKDQIHRLNSYLIENNTTLQLLLEKHNYLLKVRQLAQPNDQEERQLISKTKRILADRKGAEQARTFLQSSRKSYFQEDLSSSQIQSQLNRIPEKSQQHN